MPLTMPYSIFMCHYHVNASNYTTVLCTQLALRSSARSTVQYSRKLNHRLPRPHHIYILNGMECIAEVVAVHV